MNSRELEDREYLRLAETVSVNSPDPSSKLGAVVVNDGAVKGYGWNDFPKGVQQLADRWENREVKLKFVCHAEVNAILNAGDEARDGTLYIYPGWGKPCMCTGCCKTAIQAGIKRVVGLLRPIDKERFERWREELEISGVMCQEAGIEVVTYEEIPVALH